MTNNKPLVSIGMPVYNEELFLRRALDSILEQDYENLEIVISDNASSDATEVICQEYVSKDWRIRYFRNSENIGSSKNFNRAFSLCVGEYFMWMGGHDILAPTYISRCLEPLLGDSSVVLSYSHCRFLTKDDKNLGVAGDKFDTRGMSRTARLNVILWSVTGNCIHGIIRSSALKKTRGLRSNIAPDHVLLAELSLLGSFACVPEALLQMQLLRNHNPDERLKWVLKAIDPKMSRRVRTLPHWRVVYDLGTTPWRKNLGPARTSAILASVLVSSAVRYGPAMMRDLTSLILPTNRLIHEKKNQASPTASEVLKER